MGRLPLRLRLFNDEGPDVHRLGEGYGARMYYFNTGGVSGYETAFSNHKGERASATLHLCSRTRWKHHADSCALRI